MVIRIRRHLIVRQGMFLELLHGDSDRLFELRIVAFANQLGILPDFHVRGYSVAFDFPLACQAANSESRSGNQSTIEQSGIPTNAHESAPSALADQRAGMLLSENPRQCIAAGTSELVDDHHLWPEDGHLWIEPRLAAALLFDGQRLAHKRIHNVVRKLTAMVEAFVDNRAVFTHLRKEVAIEIRVATCLRIGQIDVSEFSAAQAVHEAAIIFDPIEVAQRRFGWDRHHGDFARARVTRIWPYAQNGLLAGSFLEKAVKIVARG